MKSKTLTILIISMIVFGIVPMNVNNVKAQSTEYQGIASRCGSIMSYGTPYPDVLDGDDLLISYPYTVTSIGQRKAGNPDYHEIWRGYLSFNTSEVPTNERIVMAELHGYVSYLEINENNFSVQVWSVEYGELDKDDWNVTGILEGNLYNTSQVSVQDWVDMRVSTDCINTSGITAFKLNSSMEGTPNTVNFLYDLTKIFVQSANPNNAYMVITTVTETEAIMTYNFTAGLNRTDEMNVTYTAQPNGHLPFYEGWEGNTFTDHNWLISSGFPYTSDIQVYEGSYSGGSMVATSGEGLHSFEIQLSTLQHTDINLTYARYTEDIAGDTTFRMDWYDGTTWAILEDIAGDNAWAKKEFDLTSHAERNEEFRIRFSIYFSSPSHNSNQAWVDMIYVNSTYVSEECECNCTIYPVEIIRMENNTYNQLRYEIFIDTMFEYINFQINNSFIYQNHTPYYNITVISAIEGTYNITPPFPFEDIYLHIWFLKPLYSEEYYTETFNIYPVEIIDWGTQNLYRYEFWNKNQSYIWLDMPNASFDYKSISPYANVTQVNSTRYNITDTHLNEGLYWIWFTLNKTPICSTFVSMYREVTNEGILWGTWQVFYNVGTWTDPANMTRLTDQHIDLDLGTTYCFSVYDYFPTPNIITNHTVIATPGQNTTLFVDIPVPYSPLNFKSFRDDLSVFRIFYQAGGTPFTDHIPAYEWYQMDIRGGQYMIAVDYIDTTVNGTITILATYYLNITADSNYAYTINIGTSQLTAIQTDVNGLELDIYTITVAVIGDVVLNRSVMPITITDKTRSISSFNADLPILIHPYSVIDAEVYSNRSGVTSATFFDPTPDEPGTITVIVDEIDVLCPFDTQIYINRSDTSNIFNITSPGTFDLTPYTNSINVTFWSNKTSSLRRVTRFQHSSVFYWSYTAPIGQYVTALSLNNTGIFNWRNVHWFIGMPEGVFIDLTTPGRLPSIYDLNDRQYWVYGLDYQVDTAAYYVDWAYFNSSTFRELSFKFYEANSTFYPGTATLEINEYWRQKFNLQDYWYGVGTWMNLEVATYKDDLFIVMENMDGRIDESDYFVLDGSTGNRLFNVFLQSSTETSATIRVTYIDVGDIPPGESITCEVYFNYESFAVDGFPWVEFLLVALIILSVLVALVIIAKRKDKPILIVGSIIISSLLVIIAMLGFTLGG